MIKALHKKTGQRVVVLVGEYDRPINDALRNPAIAANNRDFLCGAYGIAQGCDADIRFSFFAGVSKFSNVSVFRTSTTLGHHLGYRASRPSVATRRTISTRCSHWS